MAHHELQTAHTPTMQSWNTRDGHHGSEPATAINPHHVSDAAGVSPIIESHNGVTSQSANLHTSNPLDDADVVMIHNACIST